MFTADPLSGLRDHVMINAAWGLGEAMSAGWSRPIRSSWTSKRARRCARGRRKDIMTAPAAGGTTEAPVPPGQRSTPSLAPREIAELLRLGARIEQLYGQPMDIEWAREPERLWVVQARPITALPEGPSVRPAGQRAAAAWGLPDPGRKYMRASVIELLPDPLSPLFETLALPHWNQAMLELQEQFGFAGTIEQHADHDQRLCLLQSGLLRLQPAILACNPTHRPGDRRLAAAGRAALAGAGTRALRATARQWEAADLRCNSCGRAARRRRADNSCRRQSLLEGPVGPAAGGVYQRAGVYPGL